MATTFADLIGATSALLHSQTADQEEQTFLSGSITNGDLTFTVDDATQVSRGLIEIDSELLWVKKVDQTANLVTIATGGRGYRETSAVSHASGALVINNPRYPDQAIRNAINETLETLFPDIYQVKTDETQTAVSTQITYPLPANVGWILRVQWKSVGPTKRWVPVRRFEFDPVADTTDFPNGKSIDIFDPMTPGRTIKVTYAAPLGSFAADTDTLASIGLTESHRDLLILGAAARLLMYQDAARLQTPSIEQSERAQLVPSAAGMQAGRGLYQLFKSRVAEESAQLQRLYPPLIRLSR